MEEGSEEGSKGAGAEREGIGEERKASSSSSLTSTSSYTKASVVDEVAEGCSCSLASPAGNVGATKEAMADQGGGAAGYGAAK